MAGLRASIASPELSYTSLYLIYASNEGSGETVPKFLELAYKFCCCSNEYQQHMFWVEK